MTLEEKAGLCSGIDGWCTEQVDRILLKSIKVSDGPHGMRTEEDGKTLKSVCFPSGATLASSFSRETIAKVAEQIGREAHTKNVDTVLGPAINIKRSPLCGRNFEYLSEDPYLAGELGVAYVKSMQAQGTGTSLKHFAANNQEYRRMSVTDEVDERTLREIYLSNFEKVVKQAKPWSVMCSYNRINGTYSSENKWLLNDVLRKEWGFDGIVMSDWGAVNDRVKGLKSGLNLEMPSSQNENNKLIIEAVKNGSLDEKVLDNSIEEMLIWIDKQLEARNQSNETTSFEEENEVSKLASLDSAVLLKNDGILPLTKDKKVAFIGGFAKNPRYQGGGSSHIESYKSTSACQCVNGYDIVYSEGFSSTEDKVDNDLFLNAIETAKNSDVTVVFAGLPDSFESEGYDRTKLDLPDCQNKLIQELLKVQKNIVVVLHNGSPVVMPWVNDVKAILEMYLGGQAVGEATVDLLYGKSNPSGKLAETFPLRLEDTPCYLDFPGDGYVAKYSEGIFVGYRYYDKKKMDVLFPFGFGLSYTDFEFTDLKIDKNNITDKDKLFVTVKIKNIGSCFGKEVVQLYVAPKNNENIVRAKKELKGFLKVALNAGEEKEICFELDKRSFAYYETRIHDWYVKTGEYEILIGNSSRNITLSETVNVSSTDKDPFTVDCYTTVGDLWERRDNSEIWEFLRLVQSKGYNTEGMTDEVIKDRSEQVPLHSFVNFSGISIEEINKFSDKMK